MATAKRHKEEAARNEVLLGTLPDDRIDWQITLRFYVALHLVRAYLVHKGLSRVKDHAHCADNMARPVFGIPLEVQGAYAALKDMSEDARYECLPHADLLDRLEESKLLLAELKEWFEPQLATV